MLHEGVIAMTPFELPVFLFGSEIKVVILLNLIPDVISVSHIYPFEPINM